MIKTMSGVSALCRAFLFLSALVILPAFAQAQGWVLPSAPVASPSNTYSLKWTGFSSGYAVTMSAKSPAPGSTYQVIGGQGGTQGSQKTITVGTYSFSTSGLWWFEITDTSSGVISTTSLFVSASSGTGAYFNLPLDSATGGRIFQNTGDAAANTSELNSIIDSLNGDLNTKILEFPSGTIFFLLPGGGQLDGWTGVKNLTVTSVPNGGATLSWGAPLPTQPHSFILIGGGCSNINLNHLTFTTSYSARTTAAQGGDGAHIKVVGTASNITIDTCNFWIAPGFAIQVTTDGTNAPSNVTINNCVVPQTYADGIHVTQGNAINITNNSIYNTGDDAIAVGVDGGYGVSHNINITNNLVSYSGFRGIVLSSVAYVSVSGNTVDMSASNCIEVTALGANQPTDVRVFNNSLFHSGWTPAHPNQQLSDSGMYHVDSNGLYVSGLAFDGAIPGSNLWTGNTIKFHTCCCVNAHSGAGVQIGNVSYITDAGNLLWNVSQTRNQTFTNSTAASLYATYGMNSSGGVIWLGGNTTIGALQQTQPSGLWSIDGSVSMVYQ